jgi:elongation of very long chain fatty acids protein 6
LFFTKTTRLRSHDYRTIMFSAISERLDNFDHHAAVDFVRNHWEIPCIALAVYLAVVFILPRYMANRQPMPLKPVFKAWNLLLATFSITGSIYTIPVAYHFMTTENFRFSVCQDPAEDYYYAGAAGFWFFAFGLSKVPELGDTIFLVAQKKPVIFLHWYHHVTVCLYCWHTYQTRAGAGMYFTVMNYMVHSVMYSYYFLMCFPSVRPYIRKISILITSIQLLQMCVGVAVTFSTGYYYYQSVQDGLNCHVDVFNLECAFFMYTSYFILFGALFRKMYGPKPKKPEVKSS